MDIRLLWDEREIWRTLCRLARAMDARAWDDLPAIFTADATAVTIAWPEGATLLKSEPFFNTAQHPLVRFVSGPITPIDPTHFQIRGSLEIRGVKQPITLNATMTSRGPGPGGKTEIADFQITSAISRATWGMTAQQTMISDQVRLTITARIELPALPK